MNWLIIAILVVFVGLIWLACHPQVTPDDDGPEDDNGDDSPTETPDKPECACGHKH